MIKNKFEDYIRQAILAVFIIGFSWVMFNTIFFNPFYDYKWFIVLPLSAIWLSLFYLIFKLLKKIDFNINKNKYTCLIIFFIILTITQIFFYNICGGYPTRDFEKIFTGAYNYTITGEILNPYLDYFYKFPNNMPLTIILQFIFRAFYKFGFTNFFVVGAIFNGVCISMAYLFTYLLVEKLSNRKTAFFSLVVMYFCLPLQTYISIFYTDTTTMLYPPMILYFYVCIRQSDSIKKALPYICSLGLLAGIGIKIKYSVIIALIAVLVECFINFDYKKFIACALAVFIGFTAVSVVIDSFMYNNILDEELAYDMSTPFIAWIAMGLQGDGMHSANDNHYIWAQETHEQKVEAASNLLVERVKDLGFFGLIEHLNRKAVRSFGSGDFDYPNTVADSPMKQNFMVDVLSNQGKYYPYYDNVIQGYHIMIFLLLIIGGLLAFTNNDKKWFVVQLSALGMLAFLLLWESGTRYLLNYYPIFIICGTYSFSKIFDDDYHVRLHRNTTRLK